MDTSRYNYATQDNHIPNDNTTNAHAPVKRELAAFDLSLFELLWLFGLIRSLQLFS